MRIALFWVITQRVVVILFTEVSVQLIGQIFGGSTFHTRVQSVSGPMHGVMIDINVAFWYHPFINHLSCTALFCHSHINSYCYMLRCLLTPSSESLRPTAFPSQRIKYLRPLLRCLFKTVVFSQIHNILSKETQCS